MWCFYGHVGGEVILQAWPIRWLLIRERQLNIPWCLCRDESVWMKGLSLKKNQEARCIPHCGNNRALCTLLSLLTPHVSTCFPFLFGVSAECVTQGKSRVSWVDVCVEMGCKALFTLASTSCGCCANQPSHQQLPALHYTSTPLNLPGKFGHILQDVMIPVLDALVLSHSLTHLFPVSPTSCPHVDLCSSCLAWYPNHFLCLLCCASACLRVCTWVAPLLCSQAVTCWPSRLPIMRIYASRFRLVCPWSEYRLFFSKTCSSSSWFSESN